MTHHADSSLPRTPVVYGGLPFCSGAYVLTDLNGALLYVGMAKDLHDTVQGHLAPSENNPLLKGGQIGAIFVYPAKTTAEAEEIEGRLFDTHLRATGKYPPANRSRPPESSIEDEEIARIRLRKAFGCDCDLGPEG